jgi:hypothetical protein
LLGYLATLALVNVKLLYYLGLSIFLCTLPRVELSVAMQIAALSGIEQFPTYVPGIFGLLWHPT